MQINKKYHFLLLLLVSTILTTKSFAQKSRKGSMFLNWGWNGASYTRSTLHIKGADYDLTFRKIIANDRHTEISFNNYLKIDRITIPQTNFRLGYFTKNNKAIIFGIDHMKYVMRQNQVVYTTGYINKPGAFKRTYADNIPLTDDFLTFEHTDGLNYVHIGVEQFKTLKNTAKPNKIKLEYILGADAGVLVPKTNVKFLDYERTDRFHLSGVGAAIKFGLQSTFFKHFILRFEGKAGYITMPDIVLHKTGIPGKGKQHFGFVQGNGQFGYLFKF
jgi:hypothetical protein